MPDVYQAFIMQKKICSWMSFLVDG